MLKEMASEILERIPNKQLFGLLSAGLAILIAVEVVATVLIPDTRKYFYNIIENKDTANFLYGLAYYAGVMLIFGLCQGYKGWLGSRLSLDLRTGITKLLLKKWVKGDIQSVELPDQRIQEDAKLCTELAIRVFLEVIISAMIVIGLVGSVWGNWPVFFASFGYAGLVVIVAWLFKKPMGS